MLKKKVWRLKREGKHSASSSRALAAPTKQIRNAAWPSSSSAPRPHSSCFTCQGMDNSTLPYKYFVVWHENIQMIKLNENYKEHFHTNLNLFPSQSADQSVRGPNHPVPTKLHCQRWRLPPPVVPLHSCCYEHSAGGCIWWGQYECDQCEYVAGGECLLKHSHLSLCWPGIQSKG